ncbi:hypothetical protein OIU79_015979 [Salix purpurea]|uniref:Uncharacterized protein n=1 Tax=Salix purpurea TaxID=77065 RepID=A0A9Q0SQV5_SALPP|nr:hypothetical protein OIU79_015979 [Salix purpurea]
MHVAQCHWCRNLSSDSKGVHTGQSLLQVSTKKLLQVLPDTFLLPNSTNSDINSQKYRTAFHSDKQPVVHRLSEDAVGTTERDDQDCSALTRQPAELVVNAKPESLAILGSRACRTLDCIQHKNST